MDLYLHVLDKGRDDGFQDALDALSRRDRAAFVFAFVEAHRTFMTLVAADEPPE